MNFELNSLEKIQAKQTFLLKKRAKHYIYFMKKHKAFFKLILRNILFVSSLKLLFIFFKDLRMFYLKSQKKIFCLRLYILYFLFYVKINLIKSFFIINNLQKVIINFKLYNAFLMKKTRWGLNNIFTKELFNFCYKMPQTFFLFETNIKKKRKFNFLKKFLQFKILRKKLRQRFNIIKNIKDKKKIIILKRKRKMLQKPFCPVFERKLLIQRQKRRMSVRQLRWLKKMHKELYLKVRSKENKRFVKYLKYALKKEYALKKIPLHLIEHLPYYVRFKLSSNILKYMFRKRLNIKDISKNTIIKVSKPVIFIKRSLRNRKMRWRRKKKIAILYYVSTRRNLKLTVQDHESKRVVLYFSCGTHRKYKKARRRHKDIRFKTTLKMTKEMGYKRYKRLIVIFKGRGGKDPHLRKIFARRRLKIIIQATGSKKAHNGCKKRHRKRK